MITHEMISLIVEFMLIILVIAVIYLARKLAHKSRKLGDGIANIRTRRGEVYSNLDSK